MIKRGIRKAAGANLTLEFLSRPMSQTDLAKLLSESADGAIEPAMIRSHVARGAPADKRGRLRLIEYAAWLNHQVDNGR